MDSDINIQNDIDAVVSHHTRDKKHKRKKLTALIQEYKKNHRGTVFIDLDDTLLSERSALSTRFLVCALLLRRPRDRITSIIPGFASINDDAINLHIEHRRKRYIVLTRNNHWLACAVIDRLRDMLHEYNMYVDGVVGSDYTKQRQLMSIDKYALMPHGSTFVTDNAEHHSPDREGSIIVTPGLARIPLFARKIRLGFVTFCSGVLGWVPGVRSIRQRAERVHKRFSMLT